MFNELKAFNERPKPFSCYTVEDLWTDPHVSAQMLAFHLDASNDLASRRPAVIDGIVGWIDQRVGVSGRNVLDLGCGPGLYATRLAKRGARVTGMDFSRRSIDHATGLAQADGLTVDFRCADYLKDAFPENQDLVCLIYGDLGVLGPDRRASLYRKIKKALRPGGYFVFDLFSREQFELRREEAVYERNLMDGFWSAEDYFGFRTTFLYDDSGLALDRYLIVEESRQREVFNWLQHFGPKDIADEMAANGFTVECVVDAQTGEAWKPAPRELAVVART